MLGVLFSLAAALSLSLPVQAAKVERSPAGDPIKVPAAIGHPPLGPVNKLVPSNISQGPLNGTPGNPPIPSVPNNPLSQPSPVKVPPIISDSIIPEPVEIGHDPGGHFHPQDIPKDTPSNEDLKNAADKPFDNPGDKKGTISSSGSGDSGASSGSGPGGVDDGGGPSYPHRILKFLGNLFRSVLFRPNVPVEEEIIRAIDATPAQGSIHIALFEFELSGVLDALRKARDRGVEIHIVIDYSNVFPQAEPGSNYTPRRSREIWALAREGFDVKVLKGLGQYGINHNKFAIFNGNEEGKSRLAEFGSYNWKWTAEEDHYENANFTVEKKRIAALKATWDWLDSLAEPIVYNERMGTIALANPGRQWPKTLPPPPFTIDLDVDFNGIKLPSVIVSPNRTPGQSLEDWLAAAIGASKKTIDISIFAIRSTRIAQALAKASAGGVRVRVIHDENQAAENSFAPYVLWLAAQGIEVRTLSGPDPNSDYPPAQKNHHKFAVFDGKLVETGSPNYTKNASIANFENGHFLDDPTDAAGYAFIFEHMWQKAKSLAPPRTAPVLPTDDELIQEVEREPPPEPPKPSFPGPKPGIKPREITYNGHVFDSYILRPDKPIEPELVRAIGAESKRIRLSLYEFDLESIMEALRKAKKRGVQIEIVIDRSHVYTTGMDHTRKPRMPSPQIQALIEEGFDVLVLAGKNGGIQHSKYLVLGEEAEGMVVWGSYNLAKTAEQNHFENVQFSTEKGSVGAFAADFQYMRDLASPVDRKKLQEVLSRSGGAAAREEAEEAGHVHPLARHAERDSKFPPPPEDKSKPIDFNGETFRRHYFSPQGGILDAWLRAIKAAKFSIEIAMFGFYSRAVADALVEAKRLNGDLKIRIVLDDGQAKLSRYDFDGMTVDEWFVSKGLDVKLLAGPNEDGDPMFEKQHNKFMSVDGQFLINGSFNLSGRAENDNFENSNVTVDPTDLAGFVDFFERMYLRGWFPKPRKGTPRKPARMRGI